MNAPVPSRWTRTGAWMVAMAASCPVSHAAQPSATTPPASCVTCHGPDGQGQPAAGIPRLAGQTAPYLERQLTAYAQGQRDHPVMSPIAKGLTPVQVNAMAVYFSRQKPRDDAAPPNRQRPRLPAAQAGSRGAMLASRGDERLQVQACANCHGPQGMGEGPLSPALAGQHANYLTAALKAWQSGTRRTDPSGQMPHIAQALSPQDIEAVAQHYAHLPAASLLPARGMP